MPCERCGEAAQHLWLHDAGAMGACDAHMKEVLPIEAWPVFREAKRRSNGVCQRCTHAPAVIAHLPAGTPPQTADDIVAVCQACSEGLRARGGG